MEPLVMMVSVTVVFLLAGTATFLIVRRRHVADDIILNRLSDAYQTMANVSEHSANTTAMVAGVLKDTLDSTGKLMHQMMKDMSEAVVTTHEGAAAERMHNLLVNKMVAKQGEVPIPEAAPPPLSSPDGPMIASRRPPGAEDEDATEDMRDM